MKIEGDFVFFSSGRQVYTLYGIIGLSPELELDGPFCAEVEDLTAEEKRELADHMIEQWRKFGDG